ncbi:MAG: hypothetical protein ACLQKK_09330 [Rhodomicrobium sp.]
MARFGRGGWIAVILAIGTPAWANDGARLDRCHTQLSNCYEECKARGIAAKNCNRQCTTNQCGLPWNESYGAFLDRRIEENAARVPNKFIGLKRLKGRRREVVRPQSLRDFDDLPRLPSGYPGMFVLAAFPPLWFRVMDPKALAWAVGDVSKLNTADRSLV